MRKRFDALLTRLARQEQGAVLMISAFALLALVATAALVVDLSAARNDRAVNQTGTDAAATAAALGLSENNATWACLSAFEYLEAHLGTTFVGVDCTGFPDNCTSLTVPVSTTASSGPFTATFTYPMDDLHPTMTESAMIGRRATAVTERDGTLCERVGVRLSEDRQIFFSGFLGVDDGTSSVSTVAKTNLGDTYDRPINLLLLNPSECSIISVGGGGVDGGLFVDSIVDPETGEIYPGHIAADSNGSECGNNGVIDVNGSGATIQANGEPGCVGELTPGTGDGCGKIEIYAANPTGDCSPPACSSSGIVAPAPTRPPRRLTRAQIDHLYNCRAIYPVDVNIRPCSDSATTPPYIDQLRAAVGAGTAPPGFLDYRAEGFPCTVGGGPGTVVTVPEGNWWIDCGNLRVSRQLDFEGGNIVLTGDLTVGANGVLRVNTNNTQTYDWVENASLSHYEHSTNAGFLYMYPDTGISKSGGARIELHHTMVYISPNTTFDLTGGSGALVWSAPTEGPFAHLALWSESSAEHKFSGGATLDLQGVFFTPKATISYQGNGATTQVQAQFISDRISLGGNGRLDLAPILTQMILFPTVSFSELIR